jgi:hypothetical protein
MDPPQRMRRPRNTGRRDLLARGFGSLALLYPPAPLASIDATRGLDCCSDPRISRSLLSADFAVLKVAPRQSAAARTKTVALAVSNRQMFGGGITRRPAVRTLWWSAKSSRETSAVAKAGRAPAGGRECLRRRRLDRSVTHRHREGEGRRGRADHCTFVPEGEPW